MIKVVIIYLDIETFSPKDQFQIDDSKIISIQYKDVNGTFKILKEWESNESEILKNFYEYLKSFQKKENIMIIGHNILRFDIPMLLHRMILHGIDTSPNLIDFFHNIFIVDSMQCLLPFNQFKFKGLGSEELAKKLKIREPKHKNTEIANFYRERRFDKIEEHIMSDIIFIEDLWWILRKEQNKLKSLTT